MAAVPSCDAGEVHPRAVNDALTKSQKRRQRTRCVAVRKSREATEDLANKFPFLHKANLGDSNADEGDVDCFVVPSCPLVRLEE